MNEKKFTIINLVVVIIITIIIMSLFWENDALKLRDTIDIKDENINELKQTIEEKDSEIESLQLQLNDIQSTLDDIYDNVDTDNFENQLTVKH